MTLNLLSLAKISHLFQSETILLYTQTIKLFKFVVKCSQAVKVNHKQKELNARGFYYRKLSAKTKYFMQRF